jgi:DNA-directed RNA polymerase specialized sigma subunit
VADQTPPFVIRRQEEDFMEKDAATKEQRDAELQAWGRWKQDQNPQDFKFLLDSFRPLMYSQGRRYLQTAQLPRSAVEADLIQHFHRALETYDPNKGAQMNTHIWNHLQHTGRFLRTYQNIGKIPEPRARQIGHFQAREAILQENLGRLPTTTEMADSMSLAPKEIELLRKELRKDILVEETTSGLADIAQETPRALEQMQFLHMELNPEQQLVLEHTYGMYGRGPVDNNEDLARILGMTPQKVRAVKRQIAKRYEKRYL